MILILSLLVNDESVGGHLLIDHGLNIGLYLLHGVGLA
jgi:hypothetical protein